MTQVWAKYGPLAGQYVDVVDEDVEAATGKDGWATKIEPGAELIADPAYPHNADWKIPGYEPVEVKQNGTKVEQQPAPPPASKPAAPPANKPVEEPAPKPSGSATRVTTTRTVERVATEKPAEPTPEAKPSNKK